MYRLVWTGQFQRRARKFLRQHPNLADQFKDCIKNIEKNPFDTQFETHLLKGALSGKWSLSLNYEYRIIVSIDRIERRVIFHDVGSHEEVY